jgi:hypothetical protein
MRRLGSTLTVLVLTIGFLQGCDKRTEPVAGPPVTPPLPLIHKAMLGATGDLF